MSSSPSPSDRGDDVAARTYWVFASGVLVTKAPEGWLVVNRDWWLPNLWRLNRADD